MAQAEMFPFVVAEPGFGEASRLPYIPITLQLQGRSLAVSALLDTGSTVNVLPYEVGLELGAVWDRQTTTVRLTGNLANEPARVLMVMGAVGTLPCGTVGVRMDTCSVRADHSRAGQFLHGIRRLFLSFSLPF